MKNLSDDIEKSRLLVISNRLPIQKVKNDGKISFRESDGGLVSSLNSYFDRVGETSEFNETIWIGAADFSQKSWEKFTSRRKSVVSNYRVEPIFIEKKTFDKYYNGFCNATIWPLFHYFPSYADFDENTFSSYEEVNKIFRDKILDIACPGDTIWIHDYQLMLLPGLLRAELPEASIGFFLHIPFPSYEIFRLMHRDWKEKIVHNLLGADLLGFHTNEYVQHFLKTMSLVSGLDHRFREILHNTRLIKVDLFPLGIDFKKFHDALELPGVQLHERSILERYGNGKIIFSVDRLDYTKGVTHRLTGFERFLELFPEWRGKVVFVMVVVPSRQIVSKYNERREMIEGQVGRINGKYSTIEWQPILYRYSQLGFDELSALYRVADVALITPLRDGMNLVAKEYIASRANQDGVLILSELAGAATELGEAMLVNPTDKTEVAKTINAALISSPEKQKRDMEIMQARLEENDVVKWVGHYLSELNEIKTRQENIKVKLITDEIAQKIKSDFVAANRRLLFLDYDGTLVPIVSHPDDARPGDEIMDLLRNLLIHEPIEIVIVSGRSYRVLDEWLGHLPVHLVAEHGASIKMKCEGWQHYTDMDVSWKGFIRSTFELYASRSPGSFVEEKEYTIAWHYRGMEKESGFMKSRELLDNLYHLIRNTHLNVLDGNKVIEVRTAGVDKGVATRKIMDLLPSDFVMAVGDDKTDEDIFNCLLGKAVTIKVGMEMTAAQFNVISQEGAFNILSQLAKSR